MKNNNNISDNLEKEAPFLSKIKKENSFSTPKNYFESLPQIISDKNLNNNFLRILFDKLSYRFLVPTASLIILFFIVFNFNQEPTETPLSNEEISEFLINENYTEIEENMIYEMYSQIIVDDNSTEETDEYINYLIDHHIEINSIIEEL
jgi:hypothetical protein